MQPDRTRIPSTLTCARDTTSKHGTGAVRLVAGQARLACASDAQHPAWQRSRFEIYLTCYAQRVRMLKAALRILVCIFVLLASFGTMLAWKKI